MKILSLDLETTWENPVDVSKLRITEVGAVLFDWETKTPLKMYSEFLYDSSYPETPPELFALTGISDQMLKEHGVAPVAGLTYLKWLMCQADYIVAHNGGGFDKPLLHHEALRHGIVDFPEKLWLDTRMDILYPKSIGSRKLVYLAAEHGFLNPFAHRAVFDCLTTFEILKRYPIEQTIELAKQPMVWAIARVSFAQKHLAKDAGYYWDGERKIWFKPMKESLLAAEIENQQFVVEMMYPPEVM